MNNAKVQFSLGVKRPRMTSLKLVEVFIAALAVLMMIGVVGLTVQALLKQTFFSQQGLRLLVCFLLTSSCVWWWLSLRRRWKSGWWITLIVLCLIVLASITDLIQFLKETDVFGNVWGLIKQVIGVGIIVMLIKLWWIPKKTLFSGSRSL